MVLLTSFSLPKKYEDPKSVKNTVIGTTSLILEKIERARRLRELEKDIQKDREAYLRLKHDLVNKLKKQPSDRGPPTTVPTKLIEVSDVKTVSGKKRKADEAFKQLHTPPEKFLKLDAMIALAVQESKETGELIQEINEFLSECQKLFGRGAFTETTHEKISGDCEVNQATNIEVPVHFAMSQVSEVVESFLDANNNCSYKNMHLSAMETPNIKLSSNPAPTTSPFIEAKKKMFKFVPVSFP